MATNKFSDQLMRKSLAMGPSVRNLLNQYQIQPSQISSSGPHQTLIKCDVIEYIKRNNLKPVDKKNVGTTSSAEGYRPKPGPEGFSEIAKKLLNL